MSSVATLEGSGATGLDGAGLGEVGLGLGERLVVRRSLMDRGEAEWLGLLAEFDGDQLWSLDGQLSCVDWLVWRARMARGTAFEKLRIAHELRRRPVVAEAFAQGTISYSAVRSITRLDRPDPEVDAALVQLAASGSVRDLEHAVRHYQLCAQQDRAPDLAVLERRGARVRRGLEGLGSVEVTLDELELDEVMAALSAFIDHPTTPPGGPEPVHESPRGDWPAAAGEESATIGDASAADAVDEAPRPVDDSPRGDCPTVDREQPATIGEVVGSGGAEGSPQGDHRSGDTDSGGGVERVPLWQRRADALMGGVRESV